jgi:hypothetical protein
MTLVSSANIMGFAKVFIVGGRSYLYFMSVKRVEVLGLDLMNIQATLDTTKINPSVHCICYNITMSMIQLKKQ